MKISQKLFHRPDPVTIWRYFLRLIPIIMVLAFPLSPVLADGPITKVELYNQVYWSTFGLWVVISLVGSAILGVLGAMINLACAAIAFAASFLVIGVAGAFINSGPRATQAQSTDWDAMVEEKATFVEKLLGIWVNAERVHTPVDQFKNPTNCHTNDLDSSTTNEEATGCRMATEDSYCAQYADTDDDGSSDDCVDTDYRYYPWFWHEESLVGDLDIYKNGRVIFAYKCAPVDWQNHKAHLPFWAQPGTDFCLAQSSEWDRVNQAVNIDHRIMTGVVYNNTLNWVNADPETVFRGSTRLVPDYQARGLMPQILPITNSLGQVYTKDIFGTTTGPLGYDYQVVQFLGSLDASLDPTFKQNSQTGAALLASYIGPRLKSNIVVNFAYASEVPNADQWINTSKAHWMDNSVHASTPFKTTLAMNVAMWNCGISDDRTMVLWCRLETGAFEDNQALKVFVANMQPFPFTPEALFGVMSGGFVPDGMGGYVREDPDWDDRSVALLKTDLTLTGGVINNVMFGLGKDQGLSAGTPFVKVSKEVYADKQYLIQPDPPQIDRIKSAHTGGTFQSVGFIYFIIIACVFGGISKMQSS